MLSDNKNLNKKLICLDADGVLLNYNDTYGRIWEMCFGERLEVKDYRAYRATAYWGVDNPDKSTLFWKMFDTHGWADMIAIRGAVDACHILKDKGYDLICVTSMPSHKQSDRLENLKKLGFPIDHVVATGTIKGQPRNVNPKQDAIENLRPSWFVDDELRKLQGLGKVNCILIDPGHSDDPNKGRDDTYIHSRFDSLEKFAEYVPFYNNNPRLNTKNGI